MRVCMKEAMRPFTRRRPEHSFISPPLLLCSSTDIVYRQREKERVVHDARARVFEEEMFRGNSYQYGQWFFYVNAYLFLTCRYFWDTVHTFPIHLSLPLCSIPIYPSSSLEHCQTRCNPTHFFSPLHSWRPKDDSTLSKKGLVGRRIMARSCCAVGGFLDPPHHGRVARGFDYWNSQSCTDRTRL